MQHALSGHVKHRPEKQEPREQAYAVAQEAESLPFRPILFGVQGDATRAKQAAGVFGDAFTAKEAPAPRTQDGRFSGGVIKATLFGQ